jgi:transketolase
MPNLLIARPCDGFETFFCYEQILKNDNPSILVLSRQELSNIHKQYIEESDLKILKGAEGTIIATGSEVSLALEVAKKTNKSLISMPIIKKIDLPGSLHIIEASSGKTWNSIYKNAEVFQLHQFSLSGSAKELAQTFKLNEHDLLEWIQKIR